MVHLAERRDSGRERRRSRHHTRRREIQRGRQSLRVDHHPPQQVDHLGLRPGDGVQLVVLEWAFVLRRDRRGPAGLALLRHLRDEGDGGLGAELDDDFDFALAGEEGGGNEVAFPGLAVDDHDRVGLLSALDSDVARHAPEHSGGRVARPARGDRRIDHQPLVSRPDAQDVLRRGLVDPGDGAGEPGISGQTELGVLVAGHVLHEHVRLALVSLGVLLERIDAVDDLHRPLAVAEHRLGDGRPRVGVQEDARVLLEARCVGRGADARLGLLIGGRHDLDAVLGVELLLDGLHGPRRSLPRREARDDGPRLRVEVDLSLPVLLRAHPHSILVEVARVPFAIPGVLVHVLLDAIVVLGVAAGRWHIPQDLHQLLHLEQGLAVEAGAEDGFRALQVEGVVPVGPTELGQAVPSQVARGESQGAVQVLEDGAEFLLARALVVVGDGLVEKREVAGLLHVLHDRQNVPQVVVAVEILLGAGLALADGRLAGERIELVHGGAVEALDGEELFDHRPRLARHVRQNTHQVLVGVADADAPVAAVAQLVERQVTGPEEGRVVLPGAQRVDDPVERRIGGLHVPEVA